MKQFPCTNRPIPCQYNFFISSSTLFHNRRYNRTEKIDGSSMSIFHNRRSRTALIRIERRDDTKLLQLRKKDEGEAGRWVCTRSFLAMHDRSWSLWTIILVCGGKLLLCGVCPLTSCISVSLRMYTCTHCRPRAVNYGDYTRSSILTLLRSIQFQSHVIRW